MLKERATYEIMSAVSVGMRGGRLVLGRHSGRHADRTAPTRMAAALQS